MILKFAMDFNKIRFEDSQHNNDLNLSKFYLFYIKKMKFPAFNHKVLQIGLLTLQADPHLRNILKCFVSFGQSLINEEGLSGPTNGSSRTTKPSTPLMSPWRGSHSSSVAGY